MNKENNKNSILDSLLSILSNNASDEDLKSIDEGLENDAAHQKMLNDYTNIWNSCSLIDNTTTEEKTRSAYARLKNKIKIPQTEIILETKQNSIVKQVLKIAAIFILAFTLGALGYYYINFNSLKNEKIVYNEIDVPYGAKSHIQLPDGTSVWLNAGSKLRYPKNFDRINRDVYLTGEGYFEVSKNKKLPFIVHADDVEVKAIGTVFNVKSYPDEGFIETTLVEGMVKVTKTNTITKRYNQIYLKPNQRVTFRKDDFETLNLDKTKKNNSIDRQNTDRNLSIRLEKKKIPEVLVTEKIIPDLYTSWKDNKWIIESEELGSLATKLERRYDIKIIFNDQRLKTFKFTGTLKDDPLEQVLKAMELTAPIEARVSGKEVYFDSNKQSILYNNYIESHI